MAGATSGKVIAPGLSYGGIQTSIVAEVDNNGDASCRIAYRGTVQSQACVDYDYEADIWVGGVQRWTGSGSTSNGNNSSWVTDTDSGTLYITDVAKYNYSYTVDAWCYARFNADTSAGCKASVTITIPARERTAHGAPTVSSSQQGTLQGQTVKISWAKSSIQGNANFDHFELWQGSNKLYSGSDTSYTVTPSSVSGTGGGDVTYTVKEVHEWYSSYPETSTSVTVHVMPTMKAPTFSASSTTVNYGEAITLSWKTNNSAGTLTKYVLSQTSDIYSGTGISCKVTPSNASGAKGGTVKYTLKETRTWYSNTTTSTSTVSVTVRSGVCTVYDSSGKAHTALVTAYDSSGKAHYVLITAYDANGKAHNVV